VDFPRDPNKSPRSREVCASPVCLPQKPSYIEGLYAAATFCTPGSRTHVSLHSSAWKTGLSAHQDTASAHRVYLDLRSDDRGMSHSANIGLEPWFEPRLSRSTVNPPAAPRFPATVAPSGPRRHRMTLFSTTPRSIVPIGHVQPRFNPVVTRVGIDNQELGALGDGYVGGALPIEGMPSRRTSRGSARPSRLVTFSSCQSHS
jgi:hypothetical protein